MFKTRKRKKLEKDLELAKKALYFYAYPFGKKDLDGDETRVPDFYSELCFGDLANSVLSEID